MTETLELPSQLINRIYAHVEACPEWTPAFIVEQALKMFEDKNEAEHYELIAEDMLARFDRFRGMAKGWTRQDILSDRREGI